ncbi:MAG: hypothetical protein ABW224_11335 [Kibdelosporangium sp.]
MTNLSALTRRLAETPADFLSDQTSVAAVVSDVLVAAGGEALDATTAAPFQVTGRPGWARLVLIACWLVSDESLKPDPDRLLRYFTEVLPQLAALIPAEHFVGDADRREELARLALRELDVLPDGETAAQAADRLTTVDSVRRFQVLEEARAAEARAKAVRQAMEEQQAREAAARYSQV